ncbi:MAG: YegS/Rv2252/BmrU family lipid kinase [Candidatus Promineifilaceae bacterium]
MAFKNIRVIINPASGQDQQILNTLNRVFQNYDLNWQVDVTQKLGDARRFAKEAVEAGVDLVAGYGGDGTMMEIANSLFGSDVPMGILPGGTANSIAREMGIPFKLEEAAELLCKGNMVRPVDIGKINDLYFLLRAYIGVKESNLAGREMKDKVGFWAYLLPILRLIKEPRLSRYFLTVDGKEVEQQALICILMNLWGWGIEQPFEKAVESNDKLLDLILIKKNVPEAVTGLLSAEGKEEIFQHWQGREIIARSEPAVEYWVDGEKGGQTPFTAVIAPEPFRIVVPEEQS